MLIALPNKDYSFTCTLFFPVEGVVSFETVKTENDILHLFQSQFPGTMELMPTLIEYFQNNPIGELAFVYCNPWNFQDKALLIGYAAHTIVPFFGQENGRF